MPIYEFECDGCGSTFEQWAQINDPPLDRCPKCSDRRIRRLAVEFLIHKFANLLVLDKELAVVGLWSEPCALPA